MQTIKRKYLIYRIWKRKLIRKGLQYIGDSMAGACKSAPSDKAFDFMHHTAMDYCVMCLVLFNYNLR